ncbi:MAG: hypothetical protein MUC50_07300 [Myxococcota bacterium]|jgi:hypothetical protein|nr:hypothetical protein [Myxococcota bacterium]
MTDPSTQQRLTTGLAGPADDAEMRRLLRDNPMEGRISLSLEREPSFFLGSGVEGEHHQTLIARQNGRVVGIGTRASRQVWCNGKVEQIGYLSQLRIDRTARGVSVVRAGFRELRRLHDRGDCKLYVTTIVADNLLARRVLEANWKDKPHYELRGELSTLVIPLSRRPKPLEIPGLELRKAGLDDLPDVVDCLQRNLCRTQFAPYWTEQMLKRPEVVRGLAIDDFYLAIADGGIRGVLAVWDQSSFKQSVVRGYSGGLRYARPLLNGLRPLTGLPRFPRPGQPFAHAYVSHVAIDDDDAAIFSALLRSAIESTAGRDYAYLTLGFCEGHPLLRPTVEAFSPLVYRSLVYLAYYPEDAALAQGVERGIPHLEIAVL